MEAGLMLIAPQPLADHHKLAAFDSGAPTLDDWLKRRAAQNQASGASRTYVACDNEVVVAYYALASGAIVAAATQGRFRRNMPDPIPVVILARLAIARSYQRRGLGRALFQDAARRVIHAADSIGIRGLLVHAISEDAKAFYLNCGLEVSPLEPMTLMATVADLRSAL
jgi:GNAT superfamily N-acetyltransferase